MSDIRTLMVFRKPVIDAVDAAAVPADVGNELFCPAYRAAFQDDLVC